MRIPTDRNAPSHVLLADAPIRPASGIVYGTSRSIPAFITVKDGVVACYRARTVVRGIPSTFCVKA